MIEYAVLGKFLGQFEALLDNIVNETSGKTTETIFREMRDRLDEVYMDDAEPQSTEANARLIAAAPEMKDLLWDAWQDLNALSNGDQSCDARYEATETMEKIMSLLHRIDGEEART